MRFITFIHLFTRVPDTMLVLQIKISQGFLVISKSTARFLINNLVDWALRTTVYEGLIKLRSFLLNVPRRWGWSFSSWGERNKQGSHSVLPISACWLTGALCRRENKVQVMILPQFCCCGTPLQSHHTLPKQEGTVITVITVVIRSAQVESKCITLRSWQGSPWAMPDLLAY